jgi:hypothetical protein
MEESTTTVSPEPIEEGLGHSVQAITEDLQAKNGAATAVSSSSAPSENINLCYIPKGRISSTSSPWSTKTANNYTGSTFGINVVANDAAGSSAKLSLNSWCLSDGMYHEYVSVRCLSVTCIM